MEEGLVPRLKLSSGHLIPMVGLGTFHSTAGPMGKAIVEAISLGYRHFDCAYLYPTEEEVGRALQMIFAAGLVRREDLFITSKLPMNGLKKEKVEYFLRKSLAKLKLNYVDLYLIHAPFGVKGKHDDDFWPYEDGHLVVDETLDLVDVWKGMEDVVEQKLAKSIGLSNFNSQQIDKIYEQSRIKPTVLQVECHPYLQQTELHEFCKRRGIVLTGFAPLGSPLTATKENPLLPLVLEGPTLLDLAGKYDRSPAQIVIRWAFQRGIVVVPGTVDSQELRENIQVFDFKITEEDMELIGKLDQDLRILPFMAAANHPEYPFNIAF